MDSDLLEKITKEYFAARNKLFDIQIQIKDIKKASGKLCDIQPGDRITVRGDLAEVTGVELNFEEDMVTFLLKVYWLKKDGSRKRVGGAYQIYADEVRYNPNALPDRQTIFKV